MKLIFASQKEMEIAGVLLNRINDCMALLKTELQSQIDEWDKNLDECFKFHRGYFGKKRLRYLEAWIEVSDIKVEYYKERIGRLKEVARIWGLGFFKAFKNN